MTFAFYETPYSNTITCRFQDNTVRLEFKNSIAVKALTRAQPKPILEGSLVE